MAVLLADLPADIAYTGEQGMARWTGHCVTDDDRCRAFLAGPVANRLDDDHTFEADMRALASTDMDPAFLKEFLAATPAARAWEIGEAFAETALAQDAHREVIWPWNDARDRKTPRASLPGADLVGFCRDDDGFALLFGEVKTSSDTHTPPSVMYGGDGMTWQLERNATRLEIHNALLKWLSARCRTPGLRAAYEQAVKRYFRSSGRDILIVGVLLRDTQADERDLRSRAHTLATRLDAGTRVELLAWYLPVSIDDWVDAVGVAS